MKKTGKHQKDILGKILTYLLLGSMALICIIPLYWMIRSSFMKSAEIYSIRPFIFWPKEMQWSNYRNVLEFIPFARYTGNTLVIIAGNLLGTVLTGSMAAYAFSRLEWKGKSFCFTLVLTALMLPGTVTLIPQFMMWSSLHLVDTYAPLIVPAFLGGGAFNIFLFRQFFMGIPKELDEAARIDGAGYLRIFFQILMPLSKSVVAVVSLFTFMNCWNDYFPPLIYLNKEELYTLSLGLLRIKNSFSTNWSLVMAGSAILVIPSIIIFLIGQKQLIEGISMTGIKA